MVAALSTAQPLPRAWLASLAVPKGIGHLNLTGFATRDKCGLIFDRPAVLWWDIKFPAIVPLLKREGWWIFYLGFVADLLLYPLQQYNLRTTKSYMTAILRPKGIGMSHRATCTYVFRPMMIHSLQLFQYIVFGL